MLVYQKILRVSGASRKYLGAGVLSSFFSQEAGSLFYSVLGLLARHRCFDFSDVQANQTVQTVGPAGDHFDLVPPLYFY